jgi:hypothetical protein
MSAYHAWTGPMLKLARSIHLSEGKREENLLLFKKAKAQATLSRVSDRLHMGQVYY